MEEIIAVSVQFVFSILAFIVSIRSFQEKGFLLNNTYICASKQERKVMDKRPYYRQSAVVFLLIGFIFLLNGFTVLWSVVWISFLVKMFTIITLIYAIVSSITIERKKK